MAKPSDEPAGESSLAEAIRNITRAETPGACTPSRWRKTERLEVLQRAGMWGT